MENPMPPETIDSTRVRGCKPKPAEFAQRTKAWFSLENWGELRQHFVHDCGRQSVHLARIACAKIEHAGLIAANNTACGGRGGDIALCQKR